MLSQSGVLITPGTTQFTRIGESSTAIARTKPSIAPQIAEATDQPAPGLAPAVPLVNPIDPPSLISGAAYFTAAKAPQKRIVKNVCACPMSVWAIGKRARFSPAEYTRWSNRPAVEKK